MGIPEGSYAKFVVKGELHQEVAEFWEKQWQMDDGSGSDVRGKCFVMGRFFDRDKW